MLDDFLGENVGIGKVVELLEAFISEPEDVEAGIVAVDEFVVIVSAPRRCERLPTPFNSPHSLETNQ